MANDYQNKNKLAPGDDTTAELEALTDPFLTSGTAQAELDTDTCNFERPTASVGRSVSTLEADLQSRTETIERLRYELEQLRSRWMGLDTEVRAREQVSHRLNTEITDLRQQLEQRSGQLADREALLRDMGTNLAEANACNRRFEEENTELRARLSRQESSDKQVPGEDMHAETATRRQRIRELERQVESLTEVLQEGDATALHRRLAKQAGLLASHEARLHELQQRFDHTQAYADGLRRQVQESETRYGAATRERDILCNSLAEARRRNGELEQKATDAEIISAELQKRLVSIEQVHAEEIRMLRLELGTAQETVAQQETFTEELAAELDQSRSYRAELETMLARTEEFRLSDLDSLERRNTSLETELSDAREKLAGKQEALNCVLTELARKTQQLESIGQVETVIHDIGDRVAAKLDIRGTSDKDRDRVTRVLIGSVEGRELRFPLFKDRLTIGRTVQNDIQLNAPYISRRHAVVVTDGDRTRIVDWGSKNGVYVNSRRVKEHFLHSGDIVAIGLAKIRYEERSKRES